MPASPTRRRSLGASALGLLFLAGCSHRPLARYEAPELITPETFTAATTDGLEDGASDLAEWWTRFQDPVLDTFVRRGVESNLDLEVAMAQIREARGLRGSATQALAPSVDTVGGYSRSRNSAEKPTGSFLPRYVDNYQLGADVTWEADVWGRVRQEVRGADARVGARIEDARAVLVLVIAEIAEAYIDLRRSQTQARIARANAASQEETRRITQSRFEVGLVSELDVAQASALLAETRAAIPVYQLGAQRARNRLAVLLGKHPGHLERELSVAAAIPAAPAHVAVGIPADLLRRRPDLRRAERELAAAAADLGAARADLHPRFTLGGFLGFEAQNLHSLLTNAARSFVLGPLAQWKIFNRRQLRGKVRARDARVEAALKTYENATLRALEETENSLLAFSHGRQRRDQLVVAIGHATKALELSRDRYQRGLVDFQSVLDSQRRLFSIEAAGATAEADISAALVTIYKSLGGGWEAPAVESKKAAS